MSNSAEAKLTATLVRETDGTFSMFFCRGTGRCTKTMAEKKKLSRKNRACPDCVKGDENETLAHLYERIERGDA